MENIYPIYFFYGPEDYLIEEEIQKLTDRCLSSKERDLNLHLFSGEEHCGQEIVQTAQTLPMFAQYRFVLVNKADRMDKQGDKYIVEVYRRTFSNHLSRYTCSHFGAMEGVPCMQ